MIIVWSGGFGTKVSRDLVCGRDGARGWSGGGGAARLVRSLARSLPRRQTPVQAGSHLEPRQPPESLGLGRSPGPREVRRPPRRRVPSRHGGAASAARPTRWCKLTVATGAATCPRQSGRWTERRRRNETRSSPDMDSERRRSLAEGLAIRKSLPLFLKQEK
jgi:hypothetical protein